MPKDFQDFRYNKNKEVPREKVDPEVRRQVTALEKSLSAVDATTARIVKKISEIMKQLDEGEGDAEELIDNLSIWTKRLDEVIERQQEINLQSSAYAQMTDFAKARHEGILEKIKEEHDTEKQQLATKVLQAKLDTDELRAQNELYDLQELKQQAELKRLNAQQVLLQNQLLEETNIEKRIELEEEYAESLKKEEEIQKNISEAKKKQDELAAKVQNEQSRKQTAEKLVRGEKLDDSKLTPKEHLTNVIQGARNAFDVGTEAGMTPVKALLNIKDVILAGNDQQAESFKALSGVLSSGFNSLNAMIDNAARLMESSYGRVNAAIDGTGKTFSDYVDNMELLGISTLIKQEDLLQNLSNIATQGITSDLEQIALLTTIKDKTVASFDATDSNLRRLVRLNQNLGNLTAKQFGLAAVLRTELNAAFGDSSFIGRQFQQLTGTLLDAVSANALKGNTDSTNFYAVMETFAAGMYEAGVDEGTVSSIAQGINYLGSGNVQALSSNKALQNLMLLSMDRAGLDYATILQQGLNTRDTYLLLSEIIDYLADITDSTKKNNVLQSSYANLFNLSITDMSAIRNLSQNSTFRNYATASVSQNSNWALEQANNEMLAVSEERMMFSEVLNNFIDNAKFSLGVGVANSQWAYPLNLISRFGVQAGQTLSELGLPAGKAVTLASGIGYGASIIPGVLNLMGDLKGNLSAIGSSKNTISNYFNATLGQEGGIYDGSTASSRSVTSPSRNFKSFDTADTYGTKTKASQTYSDTSKWEAEANEEDPNTKILKEFEKTLMKAKDSDGYAFAVSLQGMSDGVLRSFASIFADEDAMMETMTGKNNALEKNNTFIEYANDSSTKLVSGNSSAK